MTNYVCMYDAPCDFVLFFFKTNNHCYGILLFHLKCLNPSNIKRMLDSTLKSLSIRLTTMYHCVAANMSNAVVEKLRRT